MFARVGLMNRRVRLFLFSPAHKPEQTPFVNVTNSAHLVRLLGRGCSGRVTDTNRSHVINVSSSVDDWQLSVLRKPAPRNDKSITNTESV